jgi:hypothetical protein
MGWGRTHTKSGVDQRHQGRILLVRYDGGDSGVVHSSAETEKDEGCDEDAERRGDGEHYWRREASASIERLKERAQTYRILCTFRRRRVQDRFASPSGEGRTRRSCSRGSNQRCWRGKRGRSCRKTLRRTLASDRAVREEGDRRVRTKGSRTREGKDGRSLRWQSRSCRPDRGRAGQPESKETSIDIEER